MNKKPFKFILPRQAHQAAKPACILIRAIPYIALHFRLGVLEYTVPYSVEYTRGLTKLNQPTPTEQLPHRPLPAREKHVASITSYYRSSQ